MSLNIENKKLDAEIERRRIIRDQHDQINEIMDELQEFTEELNYGFNEKQQLTKVICCLLFITGY